MKTLILAGLIAAVVAWSAGLVLIVRDGNAASNSWLRNTEVCAYKTMDAYAAAGVEQGAFEHVLSVEDAKAMMGLYRGYRNFTVVRLFTTPGDRDGTLVFGNTHGCAVWRMFRRLTWISHILGRDIVHPTTS